MTSGTPHRGRVRREAVVGSTSPVESRPAKNWKKCSFFGGKRTQKFGESRTCRFLTASRTCASVMSAPSSCSELGRYPKRDR